MEDEYVRYPNLNVRLIYPGYQRQLNYKHRDGSYSAFGIGDGNTWWEETLVRLLRSLRLDSWADDNLFAGWPLSWWDLLKKRRRSSTSTRQRWMSLRAGCWANRKTTAVLRSLENSSTTGWRWSDGRPRDSNPGCGRCWWFDWCFLSSGWSFWWSDAQCLHHGRLTGDEHVGYCKYSTVLKPTEAKELDRSRNRRKHRQIFI